MAALYKRCLKWVCSSAGRAAISKVAGRGFESLRTRCNWVLVVLGVYGDRYEV